MRRNSFLAIVLLALVGVMAVPMVRSEEPAKEKKVSKKDLAKYDADKDGTLSPEEQAVRAADKEKAKAERRQKKHEAPDPNTPDDAPAKQ